MLKEMVVGQKIDLGEIILSEQEIIDFAKAFDPLPFHIDREAASKTIFRGIISSGPHIFNNFYQREWIPRFGHTVICGMGVTNWKFIKPIYANQKTIATLSVLSMQPHEKINGTAIMWLFEFFNEGKEPIQVLQMEVMHKI